jgi:hypothetical protein
MANEWDRLNATELVKKFKEIEDKFKSLLRSITVASEKFAAIERASIKMAEETSLAANLIEDINGLIPSVRRAILNAATNASFMGTAFHDATVAVRNSSIEYESQKSDVARLNSVMGEYSNSLFGTMRIHAATQKLSRAKIAHEENELVQIRAAIQSQRTVIERAQEYVRAIDMSIDTVREKIAADGQLLQAKSQEIQAIQAAIVERRQELENMSEMARAAVAAKEAEVSAQESLIASIQEEASLKNEAIADLTRIKDQRQSELAAVQERISSIRAELNSAVTSEQRAALLAMHARVLPALIAQETAMGSALAEAQRVLDNEIDERVDLEQLLRQQRSELASINEQLTEERANLAEVNSEIEAFARALASGEGDVGQLSEQLKSELAAREEILATIKTASDEEKALIGSIKDAKRQLDKNTKVLQDLTHSELEQTKKIEASEQKPLNDALQHKRKVLGKVIGGLNKLVAELANFVASIRKAQQQFGITAGEAVGLKFNNLNASIDSFATTLLTLGKTAPVSMAEIENAQAAFQEQFGGIISSDAGRGIAEQAKELGVTAEQLAQARRVFLTQTGGNVAEAAAQQKSFIATFTQGGMTQKDAMQFIANNSDLIAKNGIRFQQSLAKAAAEAKRIGIDLSKVSQFGDSVINNFEGFLEGAANLGAMGFGFDVNRLAQIAESGDDGQLMTELQLQLASQGKNLNDLTRSQRLELESMFGMTLAEMQRLAGGEEIVDPALAEAKTGNELLTKILDVIKKSAGVDIEKFIKDNGTRIINLANGIGPAIKTAIVGISAFSALLYLKGIWINTLKFGRTPPVLGPAAPTGIRKLLNRIGILFSSIVTKLTNLLLRIPGARLVARGASRVASMSRSAVGGLGRIARFGGRTSALAGIAGAGLGFMTARNEGKGVAEASGAAAVRGGAGVTGAIAGGAVGSLLGPIGTVIGSALGGFLGDHFGAVLNKYFPGLAANVGGFLSGVFEPFQRVLLMFKDTLTPLKEAVSGLFSAFSLGGEAGQMSEFAKQLIPVMKALGSIVGNVLVIAFRAILIPIRLVIGAVTAVINIFSALGKLLKGDFAGAGKSVGAAFKNIGRAILDSVKLIFDSVIGILSKIPLVGRLFKKTTPAPTPATNTTTSEVRNATPAPTDSTATNAATSEVTNATPAPTDSTATNAATSEVRNATPAPTDSTATNTVTSEVRNATPAPTDSTATNTTTSEVTNATPTQSTIASTTSTGSPVTQPTVSAPIPSQPSVDKIVDTNVEALLKNIAVEISRTSLPPVNVSVDTTRLEQKLDTMTRTISTMQVHMDGIKLGAIVSDNERRASDEGVFRAQRLSR